MPRKIVAIVGTYRKGGTVDRVVDEILSAAEEDGANVAKIDLADRKLNFCTNCRTCTEEDGEQRGSCIHADDMSALLDEIQSSHALVLASPVNFGTVTALMKRFIERTVCLAYWPWGTRGGPQLRDKRVDKQAVLVTSSAMPAFIAWFCTSSMGLLRKSAAVLGAKTVGSILVGCAAVEPTQELPARVIRKARRLGKKLAAVK